MSRGSDPKVQAASSVALDERGLRAAFEDCARRADALAATHWLAVRLRLSGGEPLAAFGRAEGGERFFWEQPARGRALATQGCVCSVEVSGPDRFSETGRRVRSIFRRLRTIGPEAPAWVGPVLVGGFAFDDEPHAAADRECRGDRGDRGQQGECSEERSEGREGRERREGGVRSARRERSAWSEGSEPSAPREPSAPSALRECREWSAFPSARLVLPALTLQRDDAGVWCTAVCALEPQGDRGRAWTALLDRLDEARTLEGRAYDDDPQDAEWSASGELPAQAAGWPAADVGERASGAEYRVVADRPHGVYRRQVRDALAAVAEGELEKVVLARSLEVTHPGCFELAPFLDRLRGLYPSCTIFAVGRGEHALVAASPERLVTLSDGRVRTAALAGSAPRGRTPEEDERLGRELRESKKDQSEHETVVRAIREGLSDVCGALAGPETPELMRIEGIQHLHTPLSGRLLASEEGAMAEPGRSEHSGPGVLDLVARLHPTPAVAGLPRADALDWLREREALERGWYAGPVGFVEPSGGGEFWLALRSALIRNPDAACVAAGAAEARARLFAGAGIVLGSSPELELRETRLKLRALLAPLTEI